MNRFKKQIASILLLLLTSNVIAAPAVTIAWSEYPSWSALDVASAFGFINGKKGKMGPIEKKYGVDIVLTLKDYDTCLQVYSSFAVDGVCITNMDVLNPALSRKSVAVLPTSTSFGADAVLVDKTIKGIDDLAKTNVFGLEATVSEYMFFRCLQEAGRNPDHFNFTNLAPEAAAMNMQMKRNGYSAVALWNPFVLDTLSKRQADVRVLFSSENIPGEIVDMVVIADSVMKKPEGQAAAKALAEAFYMVSAQMENKGKRDETLIAIGEKFSNLGLADMREVVRQTRFYGTPEEGIAVFNSSEFQDTMNNKVVPFCLKQGILDEAPTISFGSGGNANLRFDPSFMQAVSSN